MKIQRKESVEILEVEAETEHWFVSLAGLTYSKKDYEKVCGPLWKNVTKEIHIREPQTDTFSKTVYNPGGVFHRDKKVAELVCGGKYRLRIDGDQAYIEEKA